jgi:hypothetical protein
MKLRIWLLLGILAAGISCVYMSCVLLPWEYSVDVEHGRLKAQMGDLYPRWVGTRELLLRGRNPYGPEVSHEIQMAFYGHVIDQRYEQPGVDPIDEQRFVYPVYVVFLLAPTIYVDFPHLQISAPVFFAALTAIGLLLWLDVLRWRPPKALITALVLFVLSCPQIMQGLRLRQLGLVVAFLLALSAWCITRERLAIAGVLLAISTVKPQMVVLPLAWLLLWGVGAWRTRWPLLAGFGVTLSALVSLGDLILPGWPVYFLDGLMAYRKYFPTTSLLCLALGNLVGGVVSAIAVLGILALAWRNRKADAVSPEFAQTMAAFFISATIVLPLLTPYNQVLLLLPAMMIARDWGILPKLGRRFFVAVVAWPWIAAFSLILFHPRVDSPNRLPLLPSALVLFMPFLILILWLSLTKRNWSNASSLPPTDPSAGHL